MLTLIIVLALEGLVVGALARLAIPGPDPMSVWMTIALGLAGSFVAGLLVGLVWHRAAGSSLRSSAPRSCSGSTVISSSTVR